MSEQVGWVATRPAAVYAGLHLPDGEPRANGVLLVPPFGWEGLSAGRNLRAWARALAAAGHPALRFQLPGAGDSAGLGAEQDLTSWSAAVTDLAGVLREATGCATVTAIGLGLGGLAVLQAVSDGAEVDDLVLWATPGRGRLVLRELRAFAATSPDAGQAPEEDGTLWVQGYPLGPGAQQQLAGFDASELDLTRVRRALLLGRGSLPVERSLVEALTTGEADVTTAPGPGYDEVTVEPRLSQLPVATARTVGAWLRSDPGDASRMASTPVLVGEHDGEAHLVLGDVDGILTRADDARLTAVFLGAGAIDRSGPSRLWTEAARRWARWGIASLRLDLYGIGEAPGPDASPHGPEGYYAERYRREIKDVLAAVPSLGLPDRFLLLGMCSGGFWSAQLALENPGVVSVVALNAVSLVWPPALLSAGSRGFLLSPATWSRFTRDAGLRREAFARVKRSLQLAVARVRRDRRVPLRSHEVAETLHAAGTSVLLGASPGEVILEQLALLGPGTQGVVRRLDGPEGAHTLSTAGLRAQAEALIDEGARAGLAAVQETSATTG